MKKTILLLILPSLIGLFSCSEILQPAANTKDDNICSFDKEKIFQKAFRYKNVYLFFQKNKQRNPRVSASVNVRNNSHELEKSFHFKIEEISISQKCEINLQANEIDEGIDPGYNPNYRGPVDVKLRLNVEDEKNLTITSLEVGPKDRSLFSESYFPVGTKLELYAPFSNGISYLVGADLENGKKIIKSFTPKTWVSCSYFKAKSESNFECGAYDTNWESFNLSESDMKDLWDAVHSTGNIFPSGSFFEDTENWWSTAECGSGTCKVNFMFLPKMVLQ